MQYRHFILVIGFSALIATDLKAQWEKLPLYSGHADYLVQNKYKRNEVFAVVKSGGIYRSSDFGETWNAVVDDKEQLGWVTDISDLDVTDDGSYFVYANSALWKSKDTGRSWIRISDRFPSGFGNIESHEDGTLFLLVTGDNPYILRSSNYGANWDSLRLAFQDSYRIRNYFVNPVDCRFILLFGSRGALRISVDGGKNWKDAHFVNEGTLQNPVIYYRIGQIVFGIWLRISPEFNYYESRDTGRSWQVINRSPIVYPDAGGSEYNKTYYDSSGLILKTILNDLYISRDYGKTVNLVPDQYTWDVVRPSVALLGSMFLDGLKESFDTGAIWSTFKGSRQFAGYSGVNFAVLKSDTMFAACREYYYSGGKPFWVSLLLQSNDRGEHWLDLLETEQINSLRLSSYPELKYYFNDSHRLVSGRPGQHIPDTLLTTVGDIAEFEISKAFPEDMYVVVNQNGGFEYYFSTDAGASWTRASVPPSRFDQVALYPSGIEKGKFFAVTSSPNPLDIYNLGLWVVRNYGERWKLTCPSYNNWSKSHVKITEDDIIFNAWINEFSSDDGRTWHTDTTGMEENDWTELIDNGYSRYSTSRGLVIATDKLWYLYRNGGWSKLRNDKGSAVFRTIPAELDFLGEYLYCAREYNGLYRVKISDVTDVKEQYSDELSDEVIAYPNPFMDYTTISYKLREAQNVTVRITNLLGETIYNREVTEKAGRIIVDGRIIPVEAFYSGIYHVTFYRLGMPIKSISLIMLR